MTILQISSPLELKEYVVDCDYADYKADPSNLRKAFHAAIGLFSLRDWTLAVYKGRSGWAFADNARKYQVELESLCAEFAHIHDVANSAKHLTLSRPRTQMTSVANTTSFPSAFDPDAFQADAFQTESKIYCCIAPGIQIDFELSADAVMDMWNILFEKNNWA